MSTTKATTDTTDPTDPVTIKTEPAWKVTFPDRSVVYIRDDQDLFEKTRVDVTVGSDGYRWERKERVYDNLEQKRMDRIRETFTYEQLDYLKKVHGVEL